MADPDPSRYLDRLRRWRLRPEPELSIGKIAEVFFQKQIARPHKQVGALVKLWEATIPEPILSQTRLAGFARGVLQVEVSSASVHYELDRLLRSGVQREIQQQFRGPLRQIRIRVARWEAEPPDPRRLRDETP